MDNHDRSEYRGKGITEALLIELARLLREDIVSSREFLDMGDRRSDAATKVWKRLVDRGLAEPEGDRFRLVYERIGQ
jgi:hypothetical protein